MIISSLPRWFRRWLVRLCAPRLERVICGCGEWFWRTRTQHPDTACPECRDKQMDAWIRNHEARYAMDASLTRRVS